MFWKKITGNVLTILGAISYNNIVLIQENENKIIGEEKNVQDARLYLTYATGLVLKTGAKILGIKMPEKM